MSDCFPFPRGEESQIILGRSPDSQVKLVLPSFRISAFPDLQPSGEWKVFSLITVAGPCRTYTGFPFMPLQAPRILLMASKQRQTRIVNRTKTRTRLLLTGSVRRVEKGSARRSCATIGDAYYVTRQDRKRHESA